MTPNHRKLLELCIEKGIAYGYARAHKRTDRGMASYNWIKWGRA